MQFREQGAKERRLIGNPPAPKTGTAGSIPAAPGLLGLKELVPRSTGSNNLRYQQPETSDQIFWYLATGFWYPQYHSNLTNDVLG